MRSGPLFVALAAAALAAAWGTADARAAAVIDGAEVSWDVVDSKGNAYRWSMPVAAYEDVIVESRDHVRGHISLDLDGGALRTIDLDGFVKRSFTNVIDGVYDNSHGNPDFVWEVWHIVSQLTVYDEDVHEYSEGRFALETLTRGGGDCEDLVILVADMLMSSEHTGGWTFRYVYMDSGNPTDKQTVNHVILYVDDGERSYHIEATGPPSWDYYPEGVDGWFVDVVPHADAPGLSGRDFSGMDLSGMDLSGRDFSGARGMMSACCGPDWTDFSNADLSGADLSGADLSSGVPGLYGADLRGADLYGANLYGADLSYADLSYADLSGAYLYGADLSGANLTWADLAGVDLYGVELYGADLTWADLAGADLRSVYLHGADLTWADLSGADLTWANLPGADLSGADLRRADLSGADLRRADLSGADLSGADLSCDNEDGWVSCQRARSDLADLIGADLAWAGLSCADPEWYLRWDPSWDLPCDYYMAWLDHSCADLSGADLAGAYLYGADLTGADLTGADLEGADLSGADLEGADLEGADLTGADTFGAAFGGGVPPECRPD